MEINEITAFIWGEEVDAAEGFEGYALVQIDSKTKREYFGVCDRMRNGHLGSLSGL